MLLAAAPVTHEEIVQLLQPVNELLPALQAVVISLVADGHQAPRSSTSNVSQRLRHDTLLKYDAIDPSNNNTWCTFTGMWWPQLAGDSPERNKVVTYVRNGHILARKTPVSDWVSLWLVRCCSSCGSCIAAQGHIHCCLGVSAVRVCHIPKLTAFLLLAHIADWLHCQPPGVLYLPLT